MSRGSRPSYRSTAATGTVLRETIADPLPLPPPVGRAIARMPVEMHAVVLLSGGLDSATVLAIAKAEGRVCHALSFVYGQRHEVELAAARRVVAASAVVEHIVFPIDLRLFGG